MKKLLPLLILVAALLLTAAPAFAMDECDHSGTTIESLHHCVMRAVEMGHITNAGVAQSLLAKLDAAQTALDRGQTDVAIRLLNAFIKEVDAQAGRGIDAEHAPHLVMRAENVITALAG